MKIGDVKIGEEYGALDSPRGGRYRGQGDPRQVRVLEVVTEEEKVYSGYSTSSTTRNVRRLRVEVLNGGPAGDSWRYDKITKAGKGDTIVIEARNLVGLWKDIHPAITQRVADEQARLEVEQALTARIKAVLGIKPSWGVWHVKVRSGSMEAEFNDRALDKLLTLAEAGKAK
jgi:hypothetical protein